MSTASSSPDSEHHHPVTEDASRLVIMKILRIKASAI